MDANSVREFLALLQHFQGAIGKADAVPFVFHTPARHPKDPMRFVCGFSIQFVEDRFAFTSNQPVANDGSTMFQISFSSIELPPSKPDRMAM